MKKQNNAVGAVLGVAAISAVGAAGAYMASRNSSQVKKMAKKVAHGAEKAVLDLDKMVTKYF